MNDFLGNKREIGRVVDLKKITAKENKADFLSSKKKKSGEFFLTKIFKPKKVKTGFTLKHNFLNNYEDLPRKEKKKRERAIKEKKDNVFFIFIGMLFSPLRKVNNLFIGRTNEDYFYQRVLLAEITGRKPHYFRNFVSFAILLIIILLPFKLASNFTFFDYQGLENQIASISKKAIGNLKMAAGSVSELNLVQASDNFSQAKTDFSQAKKNLDEINVALLEIGKVIPNDKIRLAAYAKDILSAGEAASSLGENLTLAGNCFFNKGDESFSDMINDFILYENAGIKDSQALNESLAKINYKVLPSEYRDQFLSLQTSALNLQEILRDTVFLLKETNLFLGENSKKRYLFVFENNAEMRASGGFIGSYALIDFDRGKITNIEVPGGGSYDTSGGLTENIEAPEPLWLVNPQWHFWDANWWPDWEKSAKKLEWFYEKSGGPTVDGVITFTPTVLERILAVIGPIDMTKDYGVVMTSDNLWTNLRDIIEKENTAETSDPSIAEKKPKKVVGDLLTKILEEMPKRLDKDKMVELLDGLNQNLSEKQILVYLNDDTLEKDLKDRNWAGEMKSTNKDYLSVIDSNIAGGKSDYKIDEKINHEAKVEADGTIIDTVTITRTHQGIKDEPYFGMRNVDWMRIYVPEGSELQSASGFRGPDPIYFSSPENGAIKDADVEAETNDMTIDKNNLNTYIYNEDGKTVFANWSMVDPGEEVVITLKYKLPFKLEKNPTEKETLSDWQILWNKITKKENKDYLVYSLLTQKQAGSLNTSLTSSISLPPEFKIDWKYPTTLPIFTDGWSNEEKLDVDKYYAIVLEKITTEK